MLLRRAGSSSTTSTRVGRASAGSRGAALRCRSVTSSDDTLTHLLSHGGMQVLKSAVQSTSAPQAAFTAS